MGFQQGLSGLNAASRSLDVTGNNVANASTVGFKQSRAEFADVYANSLNGSGATPIGLGAKVAAVTQQFTQGGITVTNLPLDLAINGGGFFRMSNAGVTTYTRNGQFQLDKNGYVVNAQGYRLQGYLANNTGTIQQVAPPVDLRLFNPSTSSDVAPQATGTSTAATGVEAVINLDSREAAPATATFAPGDPTSYNRTTALSIFDSLGNAHTYQIYFVKGSAGSSAAGAARTAGATSAQGAGAKTMVDAVLAAGGTNAQAGQAAAAAIGAANPAAAVAAVGALGLVPAAVQTAADAAVATLVAANVNATGAQAAAAQAAAAAGAVPGTWDVYTTVSNPASATNVASNPIALGSPLGTLTFNTAGTLTSSTIPAAGQTITAVELGSPGINASAMTFKVNFTGSTQFGSVFKVNSLEQDGFTAGSLAGYSVGADGVIVGRYTNDITKNLGQVTLDSFRNPQGLDPIGNNQWVETSESGAAITSDPGSDGNHGPIQSAATEDSNVDLTQELVNMIISQRVYQANAQTIKTQDQILQTLVNLR